MNPVLQLMQLIELRKLVLRPKKSNAVSAEKLRESRENLVERSRNIFCMIIEQMDSLEAQTGRRNDKINWWSVGCRWS